MCCARDHIAVCCTHQLLLTAPLLFGSPIGANCSSAGQTLEALSLQRGYWRFHESTIDVRRCPGSLSGSACVGCSDAACTANFSSCKPGTGGPYCGLCSEHSSTLPQEGKQFYDKERMECRPCGSLEGGSLALILLGSAILLACCFVALCWWLRRRRARQQNGEVRAASRMGRLVQREEKWWRRHARSIKRRLKIKIKMCAARGRLPSLLPCATRLTGACACARGTASSRFTRSQPR